MLTPEVRGKWLDLVAERGSKKYEWDSSHPLRLLYGCDDRGRPLFAILTSETIHEPPDLPADVLESFVTRRPNGETVLQMALEDMTLFEVYAQLCGDMAARSHAATSETQALRAAFAALAEWKRLLRTRRDHLSEEALRGLVGELWCGFHVLAEERPLEEVFTYWRGPHGAHQDFQFPDQESVEVKAIRPSASHVDISSEMQLAAQGELSLAVLELANVSSTHPEAISLVDLIREIRNQLALSPLALTAFETALAEYRDPFTHPYYATTFAVRALEWFQVTEDFPRITGSHIPSGLDRVSYRLHLETLRASHPAIERFRTGA